MHLSHAIKSDVGTHRENNQDCAAFVNNDFNQYLAVVCDGMGGHQAGDIASQLATSLFVTKFQKTNFTNWDDLTINKWLRQTISEIKQDMSNYADQHDNCSDMGTTLVGAIVANQKVYVVNVGDSRMYKLHNHKMYQITVDQNIYNSTNDVEKAELQEKKKYLQHYSAESFWKTLTSALGPVKNITVDTYLIEDIAGTYVLTTDGIHNFIDEKDFQDILASSVDEDSKVSGLINRALDNLSTDNLTGLVFHISL